ncbi:MAG TPA: MtnX-like HAD-IB family phosphatase [Terriglobia bacterium]|nr:MtnX-like HAD-IB family phosphatase [Terriglobia bacterium]
MKGSRLQIRPVIFCDFDGTITEVDATDQILTQLAHPSWREVEQEWTRGLIGSRECLERQMALVETTPAELNALIDALPVDPDFAEFDRLAHAAGIPLVIVSDGLDTVIRRALRRAGLRRALRNGANFYSSALRLEGGRLRISFPHASPDCPHGCATCKPALIERLVRGHNPVVYVGDGLSDRYAVERASLIFAKRQLLAHCRNRGLNVHAFDTFGDILAVFPELIESFEEPAPVKPGHSKRPVGVRS